MKWYSYIICFILVVIGTFCGIELYKEVKAESYVNGSIDISNQFSKDSFDYTSTSVVFYHDLYDDTDTYSFEKDLTKIEDFNGQRKTYQVVLNDFVIIDAEINAGSVYAKVYIDFYDEYASVLCSSYMDISIKFLSGKTALSISTKGYDNAQFLEQYFADNGIRLKIVEIL